MRLQRLILTGILAIPCSLTGVMAQDADIASCPKDHVCVDYQGTIIEIDPADGPYQMIVTQKDTETVETLESEVSTVTITLVGFVHRGETYEARDMFIEPRSGRFAEADVADVYLPTEAE